MGRNFETFGKKEVRSRKEKKRKDKEQKKLERKQQVKDGGTLDNMIAYVDEYGRITSAPPDPAVREEIKAEDIETGIPKRAATEDTTKNRRGYVTFYNDSKGFGFIRDAESGKDLFFHAKSLLEDVKENNKVTFEVVKGHRGPNAVNVKKDRD